MNISEIRIKLMEDSSDRLRAFCSVTIDQCFVVRDLKIIDGTSGPFVAMPSRKLTGHCQRCHHKNHLRANFCNNCGSKQTVLKSNVGAQKLYADVAHPINSECRERIQDAVIEEFENELRRAGEPGYRSRYDDGFDGDAGEDTDVNDMLAGESGRRNDGPNEDDRSVEIDRAQQRVSPPASRKNRGVGMSQAGKGRSEQTSAGDAVDRDAGDQNISDQQSDEDGFGRGIF